MPRARLRKTDKRFNGNQHFKYYADFPRDGDLDFHKVRDWCWQEWGGSKELEEWLRDRQDLALAGAEERRARCQNPHWSWVNIQYHRRIMFAGQEEAAYFTLTFGV